MELSCCAWALTGSEEDALTALAAIGFRSIDVQAKTFVSPASRARLDDLGLSVSCLALSFNMEESAALDGATPAAQRAALDHCREALDHAAALGASTAYIVPGDDAATLPRFGAALGQVADFAAERAIRVGVEHFPGKALPTAAATLAYLSRLNHPNLYLLLDTGHLQMAGEDPATVIAAAGDRLGYVHLDDNDGKADLHWPLLAGVLTEEALAATFAALARSAYDGPASIELSPQLLDPGAALAQSRARALHAATREK